MPRKITPPLERFMRRVVKQNDGHWMWTGVKGGSNRAHQYGYFNPTTHAHGKRVVAHRWLYEQLIGPIPDGLELDHTCKIKLCVNPEHMEPVTEAENHRRKRLTVCRKGLHDLTIEDNVRWDSQGRRRGCKPCHQESWRERDRKRRSHATL